MTKEMNSTETDIDVEWSGSGDDDWSGPVDDGDDDWSSAVDQDRICAFAAEATTILRPYASWMSQPALVFFAAEVVTTLLAELVPPEDVNLCIGCVTEGLCATIDGAALEVTAKPGRLH